MSPGRKIWTHHSYRVKICSGEAFESFAVKDDQGHYVAEAIRNIENARLICAAPELARLSWGIDRALDEHGRSHADYALMVHGLELRELNNKLRGR